MFTAKPKPILIVTFLLVVLALISTTSVLTSRTGFARPANSQRNNATGVTASNGNFQGNNGAGGGNFQGNNGAGGGNFQARGGGGFNTFTIFRSVGLSGQTMLYVTLGISILGILLALLSAFGVWKQKSWGLNLSMVIAILFLISALPGLFSLGGRNINLLRTSITILTLIASAPILVFGILPSTRDLVTAK
jgi:hypothetical protein